LFDNRRAGRPRGSEIRAQEKVAQLHSGEKKHVTQQQAEHVTQLRRRAGTHGSFTEEIRNMWISYREECEITWLTNRIEQDHVAHLQRRAGSLGSSTEESRITWLSYRR
jgi:hypothetical protein